MARKLWNSVELIEAFAYYKRGIAGDEDLEILEQPVTQRHIDDLTFGARALMRQRKAKYEYSFSDQAIASVRQSTDYLRDLTIPKHQLVTAEVTRIGDDELRFQRIYSTQRSVAEVIKYHDLAQIKTEYDAQDDESDDEGIASASLQFADDQTCDFERRTNILYHQSPTEELGGETMWMCPNGRTARTPAELLVVDYLTLGHLIEFGKH